MSTKIYQHHQAFKLESGKKITELEIAYHTFGKLNADKSNVVWVCHALTANSDVFEWWAGLFGKKNLFNLDEHFIVCANILGSHYGTTNPLSNNEITSLPYCLSFPQFTIRDMVAAHQLLADYLQINNIDVLIGGSLGGQQALEWAVMEPDRIKNLVVLATNAQHSPWGIAFNESQRLAISADRTFFASNPKGGSKGLKAARSMALLSYRTYESYVRTQSEVDDAQQDLFKASSYQNYQGEKLVKRFNAYSYWYLTKAMDTHNLGRNRTSVKDALKTIKANTLSIGISNDFLFPVEEQKFLTEHITKSQYSEISSFYGHDGFLLETHKLEGVIGTFLNEAKAASKNTNLKIA